MARRNALVLLLVLPPVAATLLILMEGASERLWPRRDGGPANSAEAAASGDATMLLRFLAYGDDPTRVHSLRPAYISSSIRATTTLEAAMWSRQLEMIQLLDRQGVIVGADQRTFLACLASDLAIADVVQYLAPAGVACVPGEAQARVVARTRSPGAVER